MSGCVYYVMSNYGYSEADANSYCFSSGQMGSCVTNCTEDTLDCEFTVNGTAVVDALGTCGGTCDSDTDNDGVCDDNITENCGTGDINVDELINVSDIVAVVQFIIGESQLSDIEFCSADINQDDVVNIVDVVAIVNIILNPRLSGIGATESNILINGEDIYLESNGLIQGVQLELKHLDNIKIDLVDSYISTFYTQNNKTVIVVATDGSNLSGIGKIIGNYNIESAVIVSSDESIVTMSDIITMPQEFALGKAFPNPFNPSTNINLFVSESGFFSVKVFNILGQEVSILANEYLSASSSPYIYSWDAQNMSSGIYIVKAESSKNIEVQRITLLK